MCKSTLSDHYIHTAKCTKACNTYKLNIYFKKIKNEILFLLCMIGCVVRTHVTSLFFSYFIIQSKN